MAGEDTDPKSSDAPDSDDFFPNVDDLLDDMASDAPDSDDFFPNVDDLLDDMAGEDTDPKSSVVDAVVPYVFFSFLFEVLPQFLVLLFALVMLGSTSYMKLVLLSALDKLVTVQICRCYLPSVCQIA